MPPLPSFTGSWSRSLLVRADGARDTTTQVTWLQAGSAYVDLRQAATRSAGGPLTSMDHAQLVALLDQEGFAGTLSLEVGPGAAVTAEWHRRVDLSPPAPLGDVGRLVFEGDVLVEHGVAEDYVEHWHRQPGDGGETAVQLSGADGSPAVLVRAGQRFGWARGRSEALPDGRSLRDLVLGATQAQARRLVDVEVSLGTVSDRGWVVQSSTLPACVGRDMQPRCLSGDRLRTAEIAPDGSVAEREWQVEAADGDLPIPSLEVSA